MTTTGSCAGTVRLSFVDSVLPRDYVCLDWEDFNSRVLYDPDCFTSTAVDLSMGSDGSVYRLGREPR